MDARVIVVGGGAAGLMAAGRAAELGARVVLVEKNSRLANKLRITGGGRCNLTNQRPLTEFLGHLGHTSDFMRNAFARFFVDDLLEFFHNRGLETVVERGSRVFPATLRSLDVVKALEDYCDQGQVTFAYASTVHRLLVRDDWDFGVRLPHHIIPATAVILATGGMSYPRTGSTGDGYRMAAATGHELMPIRPALVPLVASEPWVPQLEGLSLRNVRATLWCGSQMLGSEFGEMVFTADGVSGPIILTLSTRIHGALDEGPLRLSIDLKPALDEPTLDNRLRRELDAIGQAHYPRLLKRLLPSKLIPLFGEISGIPHDQKLGEFTADQRKKVLTMLKSLDLTITATRPIDEAIITQGGVSCRDIDPRTMESRKQPGLYFAGEIIDVAGDTGGYNLQVAFSTGWVAGQSAAKAVADQMAGARPHAPAGLDAGGSGGSVGEVA